MATPRIFLDEQTGRIRTALFSNGIEGQFDVFTGKLQLIRKSLFTGLLDTFPGAAFAMARIALARNWVSNDTDEVRRSSDSDTESFTANQITGGQMLDFANNETTYLYNSARFFNGTSTQVALGSTITLVGDFDISFQCIFTAASVNQVLMGSGVSNMVQLNSGNQWRLDIGGTANVIAGAAGSIGVEYAVSVSRVGTVVTLTLNGSDFVTDFGDSSNFVLDFIGSRGGSRHINGSIWDVTIDGANYTGLGTSVTAWEDTIGSNDGTEANGAAYTGQGFDGFESTWYDQSGATVRNATQATTTEQPKTVDSGAVVTDGNGNVSAIWDGVDDDLDVVTGFAGLTTANVYAVTDNAGVVTLDTLTAQDISLATNLSTILSSLTYDKVTAVLIYPDATSQAGIEAALDDLFGT